MSSANPQLLPPAELIVENAVGTYDHSNVLKSFREIGEGIIRLMISQGFIRPDSRVLDMGCGLGRLARPLVGYLTTGMYDGVDVVKSSIDWCREHYAEYPNFRFQHANLFSTYYNPQATVKASEYRFPFPDASFDFQWSTSLFTHMMLDEIDNYLSEIARVLKPGGQCWNTIYLIDDEAARLQEIRDPKRMHFAFKRDGYRLYDEKIPEKIIAFDQPLIENLYRKHGLEFDIRYGPWCGRTENIRNGFQDGIVGRKA